MSSKMFKVFVYGTLKRGEPNHYWLTQTKKGFSRFLCEGETVEKFPLIIGTRYNIPFLLDKCGEGHHIRGEIYEVDKAMFGNLDILEGYPNYYDREIQSIRTGSEVMSCWLYLIRNFPMKLLERTFLKSYHNTPELPYKERSQRDDSIKAINDMAY